MITRGVGISTSAFLEVNLPWFNSKHNRRRVAKIRLGRYAGQRRPGSQHARDPSFHPVRYDKARRGAAPTPKSLLLLLVFYLLFQLPALAQVKGTRRVLIANEVSPLSPWIAAIDHQLATALGKAPCQVEFCVENPEAGQFSPEASQKHTRDWYIRRYRDRKPGLIMALGLCPIGLMIDWEPSRVSAAIASKILRGEKPQEILTLRSANSHLFDWQALDHVRFKEDTVAVGISLLNEWPGFWQSYKRHIFAGFVVLLAQTFLIMSLLLERRKRKKAGAELLHVNTQLRLAMESGKSVGWEWDLVRGEITWFGDLRTMFGMASETFVCTLGDFFGYVHPEDRKGVAEAIADAQRSHKPYAEEFRVVRADGNTRWVGSRGSFEYAPNGEAKRAVGMAVDITERKHSEQALKNSEEKFSKVFRESPLAIALTRAVDYRYIEVNETFEYLTGWRAEEVLGRNPLEMGTWVDPAQIKDFDERLRAEGSVRNCEIQIRRKDRAIRSVLQSCEPIEIDGEPCALFVTVDVTDLKKAEESRRASEQRFRQFFVTLPEYCYMTSPNGEILDANPAALGGFGYTREELIGKPLSTIYAPESHPRVNHLFEKWKKEGALHNEEMVILTKQGQKRTVLLSAGSVKDSHGSILHSTSVQVDITDQKQIQQSLRDSQNRLQGIVESAMDAIIAIDEDMRIVLFNAAAERMFGLAARDALGSRFERFIPQRFVAAHGAHVRAVAETGATNLAMRGLGVLRAVRANGEEFRIETSISQREIAGQKIFTAIVRDVTERVKAEEVQRRLAAIVCSSEDAIISLSLDGIIESWNPGAQRMYGYSEAEAIGHSIMLIVPPEFREEETDLLRRMTRGEVLEHHERVHLTKTGRRLIVLLSASALRDSGGEIVGASKIVRDITERKHAEQSLRESEERFRHVANAAPVMIWMSDADKLCTYLNEPWLGFTGRSLQQELGNGWKEGVHSDDLSGIWKIFETAFDKREPFRMEYRLRRHDGEYRWISAQGVPRFDSDGSFAGYIGSCTDITERRVAQEALSGMSRKLIEAHEQERAWIARELHDNINQGIGLLAVNLDRVKQELSPLSPANSRRFGDIRARIVALGSDVQALSHRLHSSKLEYLGLAAAASSLCRELSEQHGVQIDFRSESMPEKLSEAISLCLFRVLQEALQNAIKHSGTQRFEVSLRGKSDSIELTVRDWGIGFSPVKAMEKRGLGLTSMSERLKLVDGDLYIDLPTGGGTLVSATVPLATSQGAAGA